MLDLIFKCNNLYFNSEIHKLGIIYICCMHSSISYGLLQFCLIFLWFSCLFLLTEKSLKRNIFSRPLVDEFNFLQSNGVEINIPVLKGKFYFDLGLILGDNIGLHTIPGFTFVGFV